MVNSNLFEGETLMNGSLFFTKQLARSLPDRFLCLKSSLQNDIEHSVFFMKKAFLQCYNGRKTLVFYSFTTAFLISIYFMNGTHVYLVSHACSEEFLFLNFFFFLTYRVTVMLYIALQMDIHVFLMTYDLWKELHVDQERCIFRNLQSTNAVKQWRNIWLIGHTRGSQPMTPELVLVCSWLRALFFKTFLIKNFFWKREKVFLLHRKHKL